MMSFVPWVNASAGLNHTVNLVLSLHTNCGINTYKRADATPRAIGAYVRFGKESSTENTDSD